MHRFREGHVGGHTGEPPLGEIGRVLGVTESRVCQIHTKAVLQLKSRLAAGEREPA